MTDMLDRDDLSETVLLRDEVGHLRGTITRLLATVGVPMTCRACQAQIVQVWAMSLNSPPAWVSFDPSGERHDCSICRWCGKPFHQCECSSSKAEK